MARIRGGKLQTKAPRRGGFREYVPPGPGSITNLTGPRPSATVLEWDESPAAASQNSWMDLYPDTFLGVDLPDYTAPTVAPANQLATTILTQTPSVGPSEGYQLQVLVDNQYGEGDVPILNVAVDVRVTNELRYPPVLETMFEMHQFALNAALVRVGYSTLTTGLYGQSMLHSVGDGVRNYDLTTSMVPISDLQESFELNLTHATQSNTNISFDTSDIPFRFTFVVPQTITVDLVNRTNQAFRSQASNSRQRRFAAGDTNMLQARERFIRQQQYEQAFPNHTAAQLLEMQQKIREDVRQEFSEARRENVTHRRRGRPRLAGAQVHHTPSRLQGRRRWTDTQRQRFQRSVQARRSNVSASGISPIVRGLAEDMNRKIFQHVNLDEFFFHSKAVLQVPTCEPEGFCLAMAFIRSEARFYCMETGDMREAYVAETITDMDLDEGRAVVMSFPILPNYYDRLVGLKYTFLKYNEELKETEGVLFNPYRARFRGSVPALREGLKYTNYCPPDEIQAWYTLAQSFHDYVEVVMNEEFPETGKLDPNLQDVLQHYADVTSTIICTYTLELQGKRTAVYVPNHFPFDLRERGSNGIRVVNLLIHDGHASAITNLRAFVNTDAVKSRTGIHTYCVFCEKLKTASHQSIAEGRSHFLKCAELNNGRLKMHTENLLKRKQVSLYTAPQFIFDRRSREYICRTCKTNIPTHFNAQLEHVCQVQYSPVKVGAPEEIYVYDMECAQLRQTAGSQEYFRHVVNLVCVRRAYPDEHGNVDRHSFSCIETFMAYVLAQTDKKRIYIAHNGGRYDVQFVMRYLEEHFVHHTFVPTPASIHAYLSVTIPWGANESATFIDFRNFMPGSLRNIGISFGLSVAKGDFPHRFNNGYNDEYVGPLPPIDHEDDYWCLKTKRSQEEIDEFHAFYREQEEKYCTCGDVCTCAKPKWCFLTELIHYCWLDVDVLAEACVKYRDNALEFGSASARDGEAVEAVGNGEWVSQGIDPYQVRAAPLRPACAARTNV